MKRGKNSYGWRRDMTKEARGNAIKLEGTEKDGGKEKMEKGMKRGKEMLGKQEDGKKEVNELNGMGK